MTKFITFYLPQYHPIPENDRWYGKGFTEWTNVAKAKPLFRGHYQPHIPADLGFYDLRLAESRRAQAALAQEFGISAFCYWHYWFGNGKRILTMPLEEVYKDKSITLPYCLAWANHSWERKTWDKKGTNELLIEQKYPGVSDYERHFYTVLPFLKDERYFKVGEKNLFLVYAPLASSEIETFLTTWRMLAKKEGLPEFYFVGQDNDCRNKDKILKLGFDAVYDDNTFNIHHHLSKIKKGLLYVEQKVLRKPNVYEYRDAIKYMITEHSKESDVIPVINPNWDHTPRSGSNGYLFNHCEPKYFQKVVEDAMCAVKNKPEDEKVIIVKAWNEWGEGNHLEPDLKYGKGYLEVIKSALINENTGHIK